jgi:hypothetical protein
MLRTATWGSPPGDRVVCRVARPPSSSIRQRPSPRLAEASPPRSERIGQTTVERYDADHAHKSRLFAVVTQDASGECDAILLSPVPEARSMPLRITADRL